MRGQRPGRGAKRTADVALVDMASGEHSVKLRGRSAAESTKLVGELLTREDTVQGEDHVSFHRCEVGVHLGVVLPVEGDGLVDCADLPSQRDPHGEVEVRAGRQPLVEATKSAMDLDRHDTGLRNVHHRALHEQHVSQCDIPRSRHDHLAAHEVLVGDDVAAVDEPDPGAHERDLAGELVGKPHVVGIEEGQQVTRGDARCCVPSRGDSGVRLPDHGNAVTEAGCDRRGAVGRAVIDDDALEDRSGLLEHAADCFSEEALGVVGRDDGGDRAHGRRRVSGPASTIDPVSGRIVVLCPHPPDRAPGQRLKFEQYYDSWRAAGWDVVVRPFWSDTTWQILYSKGHVVRKAAGVAAGLLRRIRDVREARRADLVYLFLEVAPIGPPVFERWVRRSGVPTVYDIDDLVYLPHHSDANRFMRWLRSHGKVPESIAAADHVIVCTPHLEAYARGFTDRVTDISSTINTDAYRPRPHRDRTNGVVIGWSGSHSTAPYLHLLDDVLRELAAVDDITVKVIGDGSFSIDDVSVDAQPWRLTSEVNDLSEIDIGVYPLPDEEWVLGKSGLKALQYMALEIPTVAQRVGSNLDIIDDGVNGFLADGPDEWLDVLRRLVHDPELRGKIGDRARQTVLDRYSVEVTTPVYLGIIGDVISKTR